jgi:hypothetical protein
MSKKLSLEEAQFTLDSRFPNRFKLLSYNGNKGKCSFIWKETGDADSTYFFKLFLVDDKKEGRFPPSLRKSEFNKRKLSLQERSDKIALITNKTAKLIAYSEEDGMCSIEWSDGTISTTRYSQLINSRTVTPGSPISKKERMKETFIKKYGVDHPSKDLEISLKISKSVNGSHTVKHWKTGCVLVCVASYEKRTVEFLNKNQVDFEWQSKIFTFEDGSTYRPDLFLIKEHKWVEIKGYARKDFIDKWNKFVLLFPNSEIWDRVKLKEMGII